MYQYQIDKRKINELLREENVAIRERNKRFQIRTTWPPPAKQH